MVQEFLAPKYVYKFQNCACLFSLCPASLFLDSCWLIWTPQNEKGPRETARSWARNVFEAEGEEINRAKRKGKTCHYTWNKACFHLLEEQESCFRPSYEWTWKMLHQGSREGDVPWFKVSLSLRSYTPFAAWVWWVTKHKAEDSLLHKHMIEFRQHLALVSACPTLTPCFTLSWGWEPVVDGFEHMKPGSSRGITKPLANPRNDLQLDQISVGLLFYVFINIH